MSTSETDRPLKLALIASKGTLDWAYPPMILASTAGAMGWDVAVFFTFYGLTLLRKDFDPPVTPLGNPAMPMKMPFGPNGFQDVNWPIPTAAMALPGFGKLTGTLMKKSFENKGVASIPELREMCTDLEVELLACQMTMPVFGIEREELIDDCTVCGAATFLEFAKDSDVALFV